MAVISTTSPSPCLLQRHRFSTTSSSTHLHASLLHNGNFRMPFQGFRPFSFNWRRRKENFHLFSQSRRHGKVTAAIDDLISVLGEVEPQQVYDESVEGWSQFAKRVSGEWDGFGADFSNQGKTIELPESVVPEAYREWEVKVYDWQTQCPTLAEPEDHVLKYKSVQLLPTVGCEADAATIYSVDERKVGGENNGVTSFAYQSSGSYIAVWQKKDNFLELEYCLINPQEFESRVRIIQHIHIVDNTKMVLQSVRVFREQWYGPFRNGEQLGGCAIRDSAFASTSPIAASEVAGIWQGSKAVATFGTTKTIFRELVGENVQNSVRDGDKDILLPKQLWCSLKQNEDGETQSEVGWLLDHGKAITASCLFSSPAKLKETSIALETRALEYV
ncbi:uncharacterized protein LOC130717946 isoform X2 [Lotus japonicus]|uniref:uncharacterized protein LOC130717946 isoform X2 n=1 Tax=Lotus japonicus TaxID=34305 RepID=UPI002590C5E9|nr:uncharacterized protein LOC130717946 isoform X2 [Lotus japonicus]